MASSNEDKSPKWARALRGRTNEAAQVQVVDLTIASSHIERADDHLERGLLMAPPLLMVQRSFAA
jgi:hypothetical protein